MSVLRFLAQPRPTWLERRPVPQAEPVRVGARSQDLAALGSHEPLRRGARIAYFTSRFPKLTETFVLYELLAVRRAGLEVRLYPLQREHAETCHPEAAQLVEEAEFMPWLASGTLWAAHLHFLVRDPGAYLRTLGRLLWANWGSWRYWWGAVGFFPKAVLLARKLEAAGVQHLHAHFASHPAAVAYVVHALTGIPFSFTAHGSDLHRDQHMLCEKVAAAKFVVAISSYNRDFMIRVCGESAGERIRVIHCGVDLARFPFREEPTPYELGESPLQIACIGSLHEVKGQTYLLQACRLLREHGLDFTCHVVGDGEDARGLRRQAEQAGLSRQIVFHGPLPQTAIRALLRTTDLLVAPSVPTRSGRREGIPVVLMEAMASGVAVVASQLSGIPELVEHEITGLLVPPRDVGAIADAIERLANAPNLRSQLTRAARQKVETDFDLEQNARRLAKCFVGENAEC